MVSEPEYYYFAGYPTTVAYLRGREMVSAPPPCKFEKGLKLAYFKVFFKIIYCEMPPSLSKGQIRPCPVCVDKPVCMIAYMLTQHPLTDKILEHNFSLQRRFVLPPGIGSTLSKGFNICIYIFFINIFTKHLGCIYSFFQFLLTFSIHLSAIFKKGR